MKKITIISLTITSVILSSFLLKYDSANDLARNITAYFSKRPMEKVFLHYDKPFYAQGEDLWYAAYVLDYQTNGPSALSEILYVELFNSAGNSVLQQKVRIENGRGEGMIHVPDTLTADYYLLKGYTNWSKNFQDGLVFQDHIKVVADKYQNKKTTGFSVSFYPEGGTVLANKLNAIAFKTDLDVASNAVVLDEKNDTLQRISYDGKGFGLFALVPGEGENYYLTFESSSEKFLLPKTNSSGTNIRLSENASSYKLVLESSPDLFGQSVAILILNKGNVVSATNQFLSINGVFLSIPKANVPEGVNHVAVVDERRNVYNERLFLNSAETERLSVSLKDEYQVREPIELNIQSTHSEWINYSVTVTAMEHFQNENNQKINQDHISLRRSEDNYSANELLIAEKMEQYSIAETFLSDAPQFDHVIEKKENFLVNLDVSGGATRESKTYAITLKEEDKLDLYFKQVGNGEGLSFMLPSFNGQKNLIISPYDFKDERINYSVVSSTGAQPFSKKFTQTPYETAYAKKAKQNQLIKRLYEIDYKIRKENPEVPPTFSILQYPDESIVLKDFIYLPEMSEVFLELLKCVKMKEDQKGDHSIQVCNKDELTGDFGKYMKKEPIRLIDGVPIYDSNIIAEMAPLDIKRVNIVYGEYKLNGVTFQGILSFETEEGNYGDLQDHGQESFELTGFAASHEFQVPFFYDNTPDFRSTLYWNPNLTLEPNRRTEIRFPASDEPGEYLVEVQGITRSGIAVLKTERFRVNPIQSQ